MLIWKVSQVLPEAGTEMDMSMQEIYLWVLLQSTFRGKQKKSDWAEGDIGQQYTQNNTHAVRTSELGEAFIAAPSFIKQPNPYTLVLISHWAQADSERRPKQREDGSSAETIP